MKKEFAQAVVNEIFIQDMGCRKAGDYKLAMWKKEGCKIYKDIEEYCEYIALAMMNMN